MKNKLLIYVLGISFFGCAQEKEKNSVVPDSIYSEESTAEFDSTQYVTNVIQNTNELTAFYNKLLELETTKKGKINIVHIGDSHVQADIFTAKIRRDLQEVFGNGGFGFTFPYSLAKTNNSAPIRYSATGSFESFRNMKADLTAAVGLSGISLETKNKNFAIQVQVKDKDFYFTKLKVITPQNANLFDVSVANKSTLIERQIPKSISHTIKKGEVLGSIANKYNVSVTALKNANGLKNNIIQAGKILKIPTNGKQATSTVKTDYVPIDLEKTELVHEYTSDVARDKITLVPHEKVSNYALNGLVLENDEAGIIYHSIGVNGAKGVDFNKFPLFNEQLQALNPDLIIISLGTNESFDKQTKEDYFENIKQMIVGIKQKTPSAEIIIMTSPPSVLHQKFRNTFIEEYQTLIHENAPLLKYAVYDLLQVLGGNNGIPKNNAKGYMAKDKVHYTKLGYEKQGQLFFDAFMQAYQIYKETK